MTGCRSMRLRLVAYADDELDVGGAVEIEEHLARCPACASEVEQQRALTRALRDLYPRDREPAELESRIRSALLGKRRLRVAALSGALAASLALVFGVSRLGPPRGEPALVAAAHLHHSADAGELPLDLRSGAVSDVNRWLRRELPFDGELPEPHSAAIALEGATRVSLGGEPAALVRYRIGDHAVTLFLLGRPAGSGHGRRIALRGIDFRVFELEGLTLVGWSHPPLSYLLVSDEAVGRGEACAVCHGGKSPPPIAEFATALAASGGV